ncbi:MAG TPA: HK97 family phage prohead protease [Acetobacteraceae bacterium]|jgi:HK97 family phage prohead protease|nr:HK97 family phage prohead protease [Acetobacteraceae bacterium]
MLYDRFAAPMEVLFVGDGQPGAFEGYGAVFNNTDFYENVIAPGAFTDTLATHASAGTMPAMFVEHSAFELFGDPLPIGVWQAMSEDSKGLHVKGKISALDTDHSKRIIGLMKDKAITGLSIAFKVPAGGDVRSNKAGEPKRLINKLNLYAVDLVRDPANAQAQVTHLNSIMRNVDAQTATDAVAACMKLHQTSLAGQNSPTNDQRSAMWGHLSDAHRALTGQDVPLGMTLAKPTTIREFETWLREEFHLSHSQARAIAELGFKAPRDEADQLAASELRSETLKQLSTLAADLSLISSKR